MRRVFNAAMAIVTATLCFQSAGIASVDGPVAVSAAFLSPHYDQSR